MKIERSIGKFCLAVLLFALLLRLLMGLVAPSTSLFSPHDASQKLLFKSGHGIVRTPGLGVGVQAKPETPWIPQPSQGSSGSQGSTDGSESLPSSSAPSTAPSTAPTTIPTTVPTTAPTTIPSTIPSTKPTTIPTTAPTTRPTEPEQTYAPRPGLPAFGAGDLQRVSLYRLGTCHYRLNNSDIQKLLERQLNWDLDNGQPAVLIVHTHATECFKGDTDRGYAANRNPDTAVNMVSIGAALAAELEKAGIQVIHDTKLHDYYNYDGAYDSSRKSIKAYLEQYPSIQLVLDLHRDAFQNSDGSYGAANITVGGQNTAQLMLYVGTDSQKYNPEWRQNLALAMKLQAQMEKNQPGITRNTMLSGGVYNQDLKTPSLLVECGGAGNTRDEVLRGIPYLARAIIDLMNGAN